MSGSDPYADFVRQVTIYRDTGGVSDNGTSLALLSRAPHPRSCIAESLASVLMPDS